MRCNGKQVRFLNRNANNTYASVINKWTNELNSLYGTRADYYIYNYSPSRHNYIYGEDPAASFSNPIPITIIAKVNNDALMLSKFGMQTQAECDIYIPFDVFAQAIGNAQAFPKAGDLVRLTEAGMDRPGGGGYPFWYATNMCSAFSGVSGVSGSTGVGWVTGDDLDSIACNGKIQNTLDNGIIENDCNPISGWIRGPNIYEITQVMDDNISQGLNPMLTHTVWNCKAVRFDNSYQPNAPVEAGSDMVNDSPYYGKLSGGSETPEQAKTYPQNSDLNNKKYWDNDKYDLDSVYGGYGSTPLSSVVSNVTYDPSKDPYAPEYLYDAVQNLVLTDTSTDINYRITVNKGLIVASIKEDSTASSTLIEDTPREYVLFKDQESDRNFKMLIYNGVINLDEIEEATSTNLESLGATKLEDVFDKPEVPHMSFRIPIVLTTKK